LADVYVDATDAILGRMATYVAKRALQGDNIHIVNCENAVITGNRRYIFERYWKLKFDIGKGSWKGPYIPKAPHLFVKRVIRGMLPIKKAKGRQAYKRIKCYIGVPDELKDKKFETIAKFDRNKTIKYVRVKDVSKHLGWKE